MKFGERPLIGVQAGNFPCSIVRTFLPVGASNRSTSGVRAASTTSPVVVLQSSVEAIADDDTAISAAPKQIPIPFMSPVPLLLRAPELLPEAARPSRDANIPRSNPAALPAA